MIHELCMSADCFYVYLGKAQVGNVLEECFEEQDSSHWYQWQACWPCCGRPLLQRVSQQLLPLMFFYPNMNQFKDQGEALETHFRNRCRLWYFGRTPSRRWNYWIFGPDLRLNIVFLFLTVFTKTDPPKNEYKFQGSISLPFLIKKTRISAKCDEQFQKLTKSNLGITVCFCKI